ncbi:MAG: hypothetical protein JXM73_17505 [Anaerolineae bacterium]|nr:hypothetical protein [Anaerolineae bacterium]
MNVHLVGLSSPTLCATARLFQERGDSVSTQVPPGELLPGSVESRAQVYFFYAGYEAMKRLAHGLVILDLRDDAALDATSWAPYADLCLVNDEQERMALTDTYDCEPERVFAVADGKTLVDLVDKAVQDTLLPVPALGRRRADQDENRGRHMEPSPFSEGRKVELAIRLDAIERQADIMLRGYQVRSRVPVLGPLIAWVRRNLTSHLREPYLDPILERQVAVNRALVVVLRELLRRQVDLEARLARLTETDFPDQAAPGQSGRPGTGDSDGCDAETDAQAIGRVTEIPARGEEETLHV